MRITHSKEFADKQNPINGIENFGIKPLAVGHSTEPS